MFTIDTEDLHIMKNILSNLYIQNGNTKEVVQLSQAIDNLIVAKQKSQLYK